MKKLLVKDKKIRYKIETNEKNYFILTSIFKNLNFLFLIRWNSYLKLKNIKGRQSFTALNSRCLRSINKKNFNKLTTFARNVFLKYIRSGQITGLKRANW